ncbi:pyruvate dehydrogenase complex dihydrolipoamide acetyltransferase [Falsochrobactrum sp. TDYN1]|uniref:Acetyltransferase component of pyruvate dehydrogenase complex n=1 Tax=Falsochrobactrum tianjinense TaxID=2706015 RepID=A0A949UU69_9HYPH|nr:pyruvate dehydrogenase complex dihydrolipoamide acetyltransferase [Falsochrobactrum sp. TDYN1]MBV2143487.1 pyruvate dehydrogenase complex dihydrolipoamide acetyltransferase [Falsochrobactrum sp. TDYN1]
MTREIILPSLSAGMESGTLSRWLKAEGEAVQQGDIIAEIETDKATMELEAAASGILGGIIATSGADVPVGTVLGLIFPDQAEYERHEVKQVPPSPHRDIPTLAAKEGNDRASTKPVSTVSPTALPTNEKRIAASPLARRVAQTNGIELATLQGSGPRGRIVRIDVDRAINAKNNANIAVPESQPLQELATETTIEGERIPHSSMRKAIARRLTEAKATIPHFYLRTDCNIDEMLALRNQINASGLTEKISVNDLMIKALAYALAKTPGTNVMWTEDAMIVLPRVDISVAVAIEGGLMTPIIRNADKKSLSTISTEVRELAAKARTGKLTPAEYQGGSASISNLGMYGVSEFSAIINPPQSLIMAIGVAERRPVYQGMELVGATCVSCTLSVDHRAIDGALAGEFLKTFKNALEQPMTLLV